MHEVSIVLRIVEALEEDLAGEGPVRVRSVSLRVGPLSGIVPEALHFCWDLATAGSRLEGSELEIEASEVVALCPSCREQCSITNIQSLTCPLCRSRVHRVLSGNELEITTVEVEASPQTVSVEGLSA